MLPVHSVPQPPARLWITITVASVATVLCLASWYPEGLLIASVIWMCVVTDWYCARPIHRPPTRAVRHRANHPNMRDSWA
jgi:hypothetical protein